MVSFLTSPWHWHKIAAGEMWIQLWSSAGGAGVFGLIFVSMKSFGKSPPLCWSGFGSIRSCHFWVINPGPDVCQVNVWVLVASTPAVCGDPTFLWDSATGGTELEHLGGFQCCAFPQKWMWGAACFGQGVGLSCSSWDTPDVRPFPQGSIAFHHYLLNREKCKKLIPCHQGGHPIQSWSMIL